MTKGKYQGCEHSESRAKRRVRRRRERAFMKSEAGLWDAIVKADASPTPVGRCSSCSIRDSCMFRGRVTQCSGPVDVTPWVDAIQKGLTTVDEVATMLSEVTEQEGS